MKKIESSSRTLRNGWIQIYFAQIKKILSQTCKLSGALVFLCTCGLHSTLFKFMPIFTMPLFHNIYWATILHFRPQNGCPHLHTQRETDLASTVLYIIGHFEGFCKDIMTFLISLYRNVGLRYIKNI